MYAKGTMGFLGSLALVMSLLPAASAGIPVQGATVVDVVYQGADTAAHAGDRVVADVVAAEMAAEVRANAFAQSVGALFMDDEGINLTDNTVDTGSLVAIPGIASDAAFGIVLGESQVFQGYAVDSAERLSLVGGAATQGGIETANQGIDSAVDVGFSTQRAADTTLSAIGASTQSAARSLGGLQAIAVQGGVDTYNAHAAPAACAFAGIVSDFSGAIDGASGCDTILL